MSRNEMRKHLARESASRMRLALECARLRRENDQLRRQAAEARSAALDADAAAAILQMVASRGGPSRASRR